MSSWYKWERRQEVAIRAAIAAGRPLLLSGEPGIGKSSLAKAAAEKLEYNFISETVTARTEPGDLLYQFDGIKRLADAQSQICSDNGTRTSCLGEKDKYLSPGVLWWAFEPDKAKAMYETCAGNCRPKDYSSDGWNHEEKGWVVLIDEIDKADSDVPNSLLEAFGEGQFTVPHIGETVNMQHIKSKPLVVITTNGERQLPQAFVRRCLVLSLEIPKAEAEAKKWMRERALKHDDVVHDDILEKIIDRVLEERRVESRRHKPSLGELLDFARAFKELAESDHYSEDLFTDLAAFTLNKKL